MIVEWLKMRISQSCTWIGVLFFILEFFLHAFCHSNIILLVSLGFVVLATDKAMNEIQKKIALKLKDIL